MPTLNIELIDRIIAHLTEHPEEHNQKIWGRRDECGTRACVAGWAIILSGHDLWKVKTSNLVNRRYEVLSFHGLNNSPSIVAGKLLGLSRDQQNCLFLDATRHTRGMINRLLFLKETGNVHRFNSGDWCVYCDEGGKES
jgi:hypothetical protein